MSHESDLLIRARAFIAVGADPILPARDAVNQAMIRRWCEAMGDNNPIYHDPAAAKAAGFPGGVAPPAMLDVWTMEPYNPVVERVGDHPVFDLLAEHGFTGIVATNVEQEYDRYLTPGDIVSMTVRVADVSEEKNTALGAGHFVTLWYEFTDQNDDPVGRMSFRLFKFKPKPPKGAMPKDVIPAEPPRPVITPDTAHFWEGLNNRQVLIQACDACGKLRHPPGPMCPSCRSLQWHTIKAGGRGTIHSFTIVHQPKLPGFQYPLPVVLVDLEEGVRLLANLIDADPGDVVVGRAVTLEFVDAAPDFILPAFRLA